MIGDTLKKLRKEAGFEAQFVAKKLNVSKATYSGYENNKSNPSFEILCKIADLFDCTTDYLLGRTNIKDAVLLENDDLPKELKEIGIEYLEVHKELKKKGLTPEDILDIIQALEKAGLTKKE